MPLHHSVCALQAAVTAAQQRAEASIAIQSVNTSRLCNLNLASLRLQQCSLQAAVKGSAEAGRGQRRHHLATPQLEIAGLML